MRRKNKLLCAVLSISMLLGSMATPLSVFAADDTLTVSAISDIQYQAGATDADGLLLSKSERILDEAIAKVNAQNPDVVLVTGDLTNDGSQASHDFVAGKLAAMQDSDTKVYVIPGEKDVQKSGVNAAAIDDAAFAATYASFGYGSATADDGDTLSYVAKPKAGYQLLMLDSVANAAAESAANHGRGQVNTAWAQAQLAAKGTNLMIGAAHHPSISRGSVDSTLIGLLYTVGGIKDGNGNNMYTGDPLAGVDMVDKSYFGGMADLADAGLNHIYTGHSYMVNTMEGKTEETETKPSAAWADYNVGSMVAASASVTTTIYASSDEAETTVDRIDVIDGESLRDLVFMAQYEYTPMMVDNIIASFKPVYYKMMSMLKEIAPKTIDGMDFGAGISGEITGAVAKVGIKNLANDAFAILQNSAKMEPALEELKNAFLGTTLDGNDMIWVLSDVAVQLQENHTMVAPSLQSLVVQMKDETVVQKTIAEDAIASFADAFLAGGGVKTLAVLNELLNLKLTFTVIVSSSHTVRELLTGPVIYFAGLATADLWAKLDNIQPFLPDGVTPVPPEDKPSAVARPLVNAMLLSATPITAASITNGVKAQAGGLVYLYLRLAGPFAPDILCPCGCGCVENNCTAGCGCTLVCTDCNCVCGCTKCGFVCGSPCGANCPCKTPPPVLCPCGCGCVKNNCTAGCSCTLVCTDCDCFCGCTKCGFVCGSPCGANCPCELPSNLLGNPGFETPILSNWLARGSNPNIMITNTDKHFGTNSLYMIYPKNEAFNNHIDQTCFITQSGTYSFSVYIKTDAMLSGAGAMLMLEARDANNVLLNSATSAALSSTNGGWQKLTVELYAPAGTASLVAKVGGVYCTGGFYIDDASLTLKK